MDIGAHALATSRIDLLEALDASQARVRLLEQALEKIARTTHGHQALAEEGRDQPRHLYPYYSSLFFDAQRTARTALKATPPETK